MTSSSAKFAYFNDLSALDYNKGENSALLFKKYAETIKYLKGKGFKGVKYKNGIGDINYAERNIMDFAHRKSPFHDVFLLILSTQRIPYIEDGSPEEMEYITNEYDAQIGEEWLSGFGITAAHLYDSVTISLESDPKWKSGAFKIRVNKIDDDDLRVLNFSSPYDKDPDYFIEYLNDRTPVELIETEIEPQKKHMKFRDDHGTDKLMEVWKRLRNSKYVVEAFNSLNFNSDAINIIEKCFPDGIIHLRLVNSEKGYGMKIKTTGRTLKETQAIAEHILQHYFK